MRGERFSPLLQETAVLEFLVNEVPAANGTQNVAAGAEAERVRLPPENDDTRAS